VTFHAYEFTDEQKVTLIAALTLAAQSYADPTIVIGTLRAIDPLAADVVAKSLGDRWTEQ
jgi:hypothetical protein